MDRFRAMYIASNKRIRELEQKVSLMEQQSAPNSTTDHILPGIDMGTAESVEGETNNKAIHYGIACDRSGEFPIVGTRYKVRTCECCCVVRYPLTMSTLCRGGN